VQSKQNIKYLLLKMIGYRADHLQGISLLGTSNNPLFFGDLEMKAAFGAHLAL